MTWISAEEKLPPVGGPYLVIVRQSFFNRKGVRVGHSEASIELATLHSNVPNGWHYKRDKAVLYWMLIPEMPKI